MDAVQHTVPEPPAQGMHATKAALCAYGPVARVCEELCE